MLNILFTLYILLLNILFALYILLLKILFALYIVYFIYCVLCILFALYIIYCIYILLYVYFGCIYYLVSRTLLFFAYSGLLLTYDLNVFKFHLCLVIFYDW